MQSDRWRELKELERRRLEAAERGEPDPADREPEASVASAPPPAGPPPVVPPSPPRVAEAPLALPAGVELSSPGKRIAATVLDGVLFVLTLVVGWVVWSLIVYTRGQTPAKGLLGMRTVTIAEDGAVVETAYGRMLLREWPLKWLCSFFFLWVVSGILILSDRRRQGLWDKVVSTTVVDDPHGSLH